MKVKGFYLHLCLMLCICYVSCSSVPVKIQTADLCGLVIDENNRPIEDFVISVIGLGGECKTGVTGRNGLFMIADIQTGILDIVGFKNGYAKYRDKKYEFYSREKILCIQVNSADAILDKADRYLSAGRVEEAESEISEICCKDCKVLERVISEYKKVIGERKNDKKNKISDS